MKNLIQLWERAKPYRYLVFGFLLIVIVLQWCQLQSRKPIQVIPEKVVENVKEYLPAEHDGGNWSGWMPFILISALAIVFFLAHRRGWVEKLIPGMVLVRMRILRQKQTGKRVLQLFIMNTKRESQTFDSPVIHFFKPGKKKSYRIKVNHNDLAFPLTLTSHTSHKLNIDLDQFYNKDPELKKYWFVQVSIPCGMRIKRTFYGLILFQGK